jgi:hypothetical protein
MTMSTRSACGWASCLERPRQWGACRLALQMWQKLALDEFRRPRLAPSREGTS